MPPEKDIPSESLDELLAYVESNARRYDNLYSLAQPLQNVRDASHAAANADKEFQAQVEIDAFSFYLHDGHLGPMYQGTTQDGKPAEYPSVSRFDTNAIDYLRTRTTACANPILLARYSHILWAATKDIQHANAAISNYLLAARDYTLSDKEDPEDFFSLSILDCLIASANLSLSVASDKIAQVIDQMLQVIQTQSDGKRAHVTVLLSLAHYLLSNRKKLQRAGLLDCLPYCTVEYARQRKHGDFHTAIDLIEIARRIELCLGKHSLNWEEELAKNYESLASSGQYDDLARVSFIEDAILHYTRAKKLDKADSLLQILTETRDRTHFGKVTANIDLSPQLRECDRLARLVCDNGSDYVVNYLMMSKDLLPDYDLLVASAQKTSPLLMAIPSAIIDSLGNTVRHFSSTDEKSYFTVLQSCGMALDTTYFLLLRAVLFEALGRRMLTAPILLDHLANHSWIGKEIDVTISGVAQSHRWIDQLIPALNDYFTSIDMHLKSRDFRPSFIEPIDSLSTKFEGLVRDMCKLSGVSTVEIRQDSSGRTTSTEKDLHALLYEPAVSKLYDKTDLLFFRYLLVEHAGYAVRHKVAHSQMQMKDYGLKIMNYVLLALLRIGRYDLKTKP